VIKTLAVKIESDFTQSLIEVENSNTQEKRKLWHWLYKCWPDQNIPKPTSLLAFFEKINASSEHCFTNPNSAPVIVHCSAGLGRAGTFVALANCLAEFEDTGTVDLPSTITAIRSQRAHLVTTQKQYLFCYSLLLNTRHPANT